MRTVGLFLLAMLALARPVQAMPCHCFNEKVYDPGQPAAADPYFLAAAQNAFFALVSGMEKSQVVFAKQKSYATAEGLWIAHWLAERSGANAVALQKARRRLPSWRAAVAAQHIEPGTLAPRFITLLAHEGADAELSRFVVDEALAARGVAGAELAAVRAQGASDPETILAVLLARKSGRPASTYVEENRLRQASWGALLLRAGIDGSNLADEVQRLAARR